MPFHAENQKKTERKSVIFLRFKIYFRQTGDQGLFFFPFVDFL
jgi:hypothetical protein